MGEIEKTINQMKNAQKQWSEAKTRLDQTIELRLQEAKVSVANYDLHYDSRTGKTTKMKKLGGNTEARFANKSQMMTTSRNIKISKLWKEMIHDINPP